VRAGVFDDETQGRRCGARFDGRIDQSRGSMDKNQTQRRPSRTSEHMTAKSAGHKELTW
jgi:hypothetical protein